MRLEKKLNTNLRSLIRDIKRKSQFMFSDSIPPILSKSISKALKISFQERRDKNKIYSWHATEVECIGKGKSNKPYEFGCKVSLATNLYPARGGHFILHTHALHGNPYDGHTLQGAIDHMKKIVGKAPNRIVIDDGYKGRHYKNPHHAYKSSQKRGVTAEIKRDLRRRAVIEPIIGHVKHDCRMAKNYLKGEWGDRINAKLAAIAYNFRKIRAWIRSFWTFFIYIMQKDEITKSRSFNHRMYYVL